MNKKGFTYLISAIFLAAILLAVFSASGEYSLRDKQKSESKRIIYDNDFIKGFDQDFERAVQISSIRAMVSLEDHIATSYSFLNNTEDAFKEAIYYGTINGSATLTMGNSTLLNYTEKVSRLSSRFGLNVSINITDIRLNQTNPWFLDVEADADVIINDTSGLAYWNYNKTFYAKVSILNLRDPLYMVHFPSALHNTIRKNNFTYFVSSDNVTYNLSNHTIGGFYIENINAPNYIMRMENNYSPSPTGIESIVNIDELRIQDEDHPWIFEDRIKIDFIYFNNLTNDSNNIPYVKICDITDMSEDFIITQDRLSMYNVSLLNYSTDCD